MDGLANLRKIEHVVVLMLENRSFDHMLGYLALEGGRSDVDGLRSTMANTHGGKTYRVRHLARTALGEDQDPCHSSACVARQLRNSSGGFVADYATTHPNDANPGLVMGYYNADDLPVYDHLAREFCVCDRWFCSVAGPTWPNRLYAVTGRAAGSKDNKKLPIYDLPSFVRHLDARRVSWRWYAHDVSTLRLMDERYRVGSFKHFAYFDRRSLLAPKSFMDDAAAGDLAAVSWIDPNFVDLTFIGPSGSNDDHPPSDVMGGQALVLGLYNALVHSPVWKKTLLVILYDEHGGFYDHVAPPAARDDNARFRSYGARVPALVVSPWVRRGSVSNTLFDHTSVLKTILLRFCRKPDGTIPNVGARVTHANHLGSLLALRAARKPTPFSAYRHLVQRVAQWRSEVFEARLETQVRRAPARPPQLNELQEGVLAAKRRLRAEGLPEGQP